MRCVRFGLRFYGATCNMTCPGGSANPCSGHGITARYSDALLQPPTTPLLFSFVRCFTLFFFFVCFCLFVCLFVGVSSCNADGSCSCQSGWWGAACNQTCPGTAPSPTSPSTLIPCSGHGACSAVSGQCSCAVGYAGADCSKLCPGAASGPACSGKGLCDALSGECKCVAGYYGSDCSRMSDGMNE